jgi:hypothetical protein
MVGWTHKHEPAERHIFHGPRHTSYITGMLGLDEHHSDIIEGGCCPAPAAIVG